MPVSIEKQFHPILIGGHIGQGSSTLASIYNLNYPRSVTLDILVFIKIAKKAENLLYYIIGYYTPH